MPKVTSMPPTAYNRTISTIRDYPRMVYELEQLKRDAGCLKGTNYDAMPKGSSGGSGLDAKIAEIVDLETEIQKMQECIDTIPADMRDGILDNILYNTGFPRNEHGQLVPEMSTWKRAKREFIVRVAHKFRIYSKKGA